MHPTRSYFCPMLVSGIDTSVNIDRTRPIGGAEIPSLTIGVTLLLLCDAADIICLRSTVF
jgi:hypothetical protein